MKNIPVETLTQGCRECGEDTVQDVKQRFPDGSGYTKCERCGKVIVNSAGSIPTRPIPRQHNRHDVDVNQVTKAHRTQAQEGRF